MRGKRKENIWRKKRKGIFFSRCFYLLLEVFVLAFVVEFTDLKEFVGDKAFRSVYAKEVSEYDLFAKAAVLMDGKSGRILYEKNGAAFLSNASTTKIMTCILVLENAGLEEYVRVSANAARQPDVQAHLEEGEYYLVKDLLYSLMLESHNDSAYALAEHVGKTAEEFAEMMNKKAKELGCENTYFVTPNGLDQLNTETGLPHGTCAKDLARMMKYCILESEKKDLFLKITGQMQYFFCGYQREEQTNEFVPLSKQIYCQNHNALFQMVKGVMSGKTGYTNKAGYCYVGAVNDKERIFIVALLGSGWPPRKTDKWKDSMKLIQYAKEDYENKEVIMGNIKLPELEVRNGIPEELSFEAVAKTELLCNPQCIEVLLKEDELVVEKINLKTSVENQIHQGEKVGKITYYIEGLEIKSLPIITKTKIDCKDARWAIKTLWSMYLEKFVP